MGTPIEKLNKYHSEVFAKGCTIESEVSRLCGGKSQIVRMIDNPQRLYKFVYEPGTSNVTEMYTKVVEGPYSLIFDWIRI